MKMMWFNGKGFTLVEIMIVVAIIGLLAAIAIPNFIQARTTTRLNACRNNQRIISAAIQQWAMETSQLETAVVSTASGAWGAYIKGGVPQCPVGPTAYTYGTTDTVAGYKVTCAAVAAHTLP